MYRIEGIRSNGSKFYKEYDDKKVARFEYELTQIVSDEIRLFENDILINEYVKPKNVAPIEYIVRGKSAFNNIHKIIKNDRERAELVFKSESQRCDWVTLYEKKDNSEIQLELFIKGVA